MALVRHFIAKNNVPEFGRFQNERSQPSQYAAFAPIAMPEWRIISRRRALARHHQHGAATRSRGTQQKCSQNMLGCILTYAMQVKFGVNLHGAPNHGPTLLPGHGDHGRQGCWRQWPNGQISQAPGLSRGLGSCFLSL